LWQAELTAAAHRSICRTIVQSMPLWLRNALRPAWTAVCDRVRAWPLVWRHGWPGVILHFEGGIGDDLMCTVAIRELHARGVRRLWMMSDHADLFEGGGNLQVVPEQRLRIAQRAWPTKVRALEYNHYVAERDRSEPPVRHIIAEMCARAGVTGSVALRPRLALSANERRAAEWARGAIAIQSGALARGKLIRTKQWYPERFQEVVDALVAEFRIVQLGSTIDPLLHGTADWRGVSRRQTAAILSHAGVYVGQVGFLMHLARAVDCPGVIVYGGREAPWQSGYVCNVNLYNPVDCAPCWRWLSCDHDRKCMAGISADDVVRAVRARVARPRSPLAIQWAAI